ncbi:Glu/Leu/Phe/Val dehydrogenase dimerization domain-containing protein [Microbulbifer bruguierae]|uniref:Glu/Leu/Phe/Val dehydrogenase dimerization domain-containing protein n=1 Tax=Microbulbifer bruguierae TaxID=3029061 RepID=A0ABY8NCU0_9GAMM|nr:Glu/Leu/Phe/Val dehydrogenase dimerization domain-containing protein [Microbulbifer bruguierae]WGL16741.1 Glu/Leu/Phe/Val dehydrogenase dimerization domain-containing protein [Microbulbifer bruguierae]
MSVFSHPAYDNHEEVAFYHDAKSGLKAIIAVHNTNLGPSLGGCRMWPYADDAEALNDVLRLSRGMTYKSAMAGLKLGGGKSVIIGDPRKQKTPELLRAMGDFLNTLGGRYITAEDSGTSVADMKIIGERSEYVSGVIAGQEHGGDPSPSTAYGVFVGLKAAVAHRWGRTDLNGLKVSIQGVGNVGFRLAKLLKHAGAELFVTDIFQDNVDRVVNELGATAVSADEIFDLDVDLFAPCAMGAILNDDTISRLKVGAIAGAANNQLAEARHAQMLKDKGILYAPDYVINAGGIIDVYYQQLGEYNADQVKAHIETIGTTLQEVFERADQSGETTALVADRIAEERFGHKDTLNSTNSAAA